MNPRVRKLYITLLKAALLSIIFLLLTFSPAVAAIASAQSIGAAANNYWTWYDNVGGDNWVLAANPSSAPGSLTYSLSIAGRPMDLSGYNGGVVAPGNSITPSYKSTVGGPVKTSSLTGSEGIASQRIIWPKGGSSLEEVSGTKESRLSDHFLWTWYDQLGAGYTNWILVSNPGTSAIYYRITIAGRDPGRGSSGSVAPGSNVTPTFPGIMGGPVELRVWADNVGGSTPAKALASQRVLSNFGSAFNEIPGTPAGELSDHYYWTWYDMKSPGAKDWVLVANPSATSRMYYEIDIAGRNMLDDRSTGPLQPGQKITPVFPGAIGGPVEVKTFLDAAHTIPANSISSQRSIWGPSFEEVPGLAASGAGGYSALATSYNWTWYDQATPGMTNWVLVANPDRNNAVNATIRVGTRFSRTYNIPPGRSISPTFPGSMGGPVEISATGQVIASQRILYNGYFNETAGEPAASAPSPPQPGPQRLAMPPAGSLYHGVFPGAPGLTNEDDITPQTYAAYVQASGKTAAWIYFSNDWFISRSFPQNTAEWIRQSGSIPFARLMLRSTDELNVIEPVFTLSNIINGDFDADLRAWMRAARDFGSPIMVEYGTEVNCNSWSWNAQYNGRTTGPALFQQAYRHIIQISREEGATNITWVFHANYDDDPIRTWNRLENYYLGDDWIDLIGVSVYGPQSPTDTETGSFRDLMDQVYPRLASLSQTKPIAVLEFGATAGNPGVDQAAWGTAALQDLTSGRWPRLIGFAWWNDGWPNDSNPLHDSDMYIQNDPALADAFKTYAGANSQVLGEPLISGQ